MTITRTDTIELPWGTVLVVHATTQSLDTRANIDLFHRELLHALTPSDCTVAIVDFAEVDNCSSEVLGALLRAQKLMFGTGRTLRVANLAPPLSSMFRVCSLDVIIPVAPTVEDAIAAHEREMRA